MLACKYSENTIATQSDYLKSSTKKTNLAAKIKQTKRDDEIQRNKKKIHSKIRNKTKQKNNSNKRKGNNKE